MRTSYLLHHLLEFSAARFPEQIALTYQNVHISYGALNESCANFSAFVQKIGLARQERVAVYLEKRPEFVVSCLGASSAGLIFIPVNPVLKPAQVGLILADSGAKFLVLRPFNFCRFCI